MNRNKIDKDIIITKNTEKEITSGSLSLHFIPAWQFALEKGKTFRELSNG
jgi:hypothetical protein